MAVGDGRGLEAKPSRPRFVLLEADQILVLRVCGLCADVDHRTDGLGGR